MKICLTGGIACGKSLLSRYLNELGVATIDADDIVHDLIPDPAERRRIAAEVFADPVKRQALEARLHPIVKARIDAFLGNGRISEWPNGRMVEGGRVGDVANPVAVGSAKPWAGETRATGGARVSSPSGLSSPSRPSGQASVSSCLSSPFRQKNSSSSRLAPCSFRLAIIPLLFEAHWEKNFDIICCVASERETQISRMMTTRGYTRAEAEARLAAQMPVAEKAAKSHYVIHNDGTSAELKEQAKQFVKWLTHSMFSPAR